MKTVEEKLQDFENYLLEKEIMMSQEIAKDCTDPFYSGAFTWINAIRREFKERFLND